MTLIQKVGILLDILLFILMMWTGIHLIVNPECFSIDDLRWIGGVLICFYFCSIIPVIINHHKK